MKGDIVAQLNQEVRVIDKQVIVTINQDLSQATDKTATQHAQGVPLTAAAANNHNSKIDDAVNKTKGTGPQSDGESPPEEGGLPEIEDKNTPACETFTEVNTDNKQEKTAVTEGGSTQRMKQSLPGVHENILEVDDNNVKMTRSKVMERSEEEEVIVQDEGVVTKDDLEKQHKDPTEDDENISGAVSDSESNEEIEDITKLAGELKITRDDAPEVEDSADEEQASEIDTKLTIDLEKLHIQVSEEKHSLKGRAPVHGSDAQFTEYPDLDLFNWNDDDDEDERNIRTKPELIHSSKRSAEQDFPSAAYKFHHPNHHDEYLSAIVQQTNIYPRQPTPKVAVEHDETSTMGMSGTRSTMGTSGGRVTIVPTTNSTPPQGLGMPIMSFSQMNAISIPGMTGLYDQIPPTPPSVHAPSSGYNSTSDVFSPDVPSPGGSSYSEVFSPPPQSDMVNIGSPDQVTPGSGSTPPQTNELLLQNLDEFDHVYEEVKRNGDLCSPPISHQEWKLIDQLMISATESASPFQQIIDNSQQVPQLPNSSATFATNQPITGSHGNNMSGHSLQPVLTPVSQFQPAIIEQPAIPMIPDLVSDSQLDILDDEFLNGITGGMDINSPSPSVTRAPGLPSHQMSPDVSTYNQQQSPDVSTYNQQQSPDVSTYNLEQGMTLISSASGLITSSGINSTASRLSAKQSHKMQKILKTYPEIKPNVGSATPHVRNGSVTTHMTAGGVAMTTQAAAPLLPAPGHHECQTQIKSYTGQPISHQNPAPPIVVLPCTDEEYQVEETQALSYVSNLTSERLLYKDDEEDTLLHISVENQLYYLVKALLTRCVRENVLDKLINQSNSEYQTPLYIALKSTPEGGKRCRKLELVTELVKHGADIYKACCDGRSRDTGLETIYQTPVHLAAYLGEAQCLNVMLKMGGVAKINDQNTLQETPLHCAVRRNRTGCHDVIRVLKAAVCDFKAKAKTGQTILHVIAGKLDLDLLVFLVDELGQELFREVVNEQDDSGNTPLHYLVYYLEGMSGPRVHKPIPQPVHRRMIEILMHNGAESKIKNSQSRTAHQSGSKNEYISDLFKKPGIRGQGKTQKPGPRPTLVPARKFSEGNQPVGGAMLPVQHMAAPIMSIPQGVRNMGPPPPPPQLPMGPPPPPSQLPMGPPRGNFLRSHTMLSQPHTFMGPPAAPTGARHQNLPHQTQNTNPQMMIPRQDLMSTGLVAASSVAISAHSNVALNVACNSGLQTIPVTSFSMRSPVTPLHGHMVTAHNNVASMSSTLPVFVANFDSNSLSSTTNTSCLHLQQN